MEVITINEDNLKKCDIEKSSIKVRAILYHNDNILVANYNGIYLLPGGKVESNESIYDALQRELLEETGVLYTESELKPILKLRYYQKDYLTTDNKTLNRYILTHYYVGKFRGIDFTKVRRSQREIEGNFRLQLMDMEELYKDMLLCDNPRKDYFNRELNEVVKVYKKVR